MVWERGGDSVPRLIVHMDTNTRQRIPISLHTATDNVLRAHVSMIVHDEAKNPTC